MYPLDVDKGLPMKSLESIVSAICTLGFSAETNLFFAKNKNFILESWSNSAATSDILERIGFSVEDFTSQIAEPVYTYLCHILKQKSISPECPAMRSLVERFYTIGLSVEEVYINCTTFKNMIIRTYDERGNDAIREEKHKVIMLLDYNLYGILAIYTQILDDMKKELGIRNTIIQENVLFSRTDLHGVILETTDAFCELCGYTKEELIGNTHSLLKHPSVDEEIYKDMWKTILQGKKWKGKLPNLRKDGSTFIISLTIIPTFDEEGKVVEFMAFRNDITSDQLAQHDQLTQLYNRRAFDKQFTLLFTKSSIADEPLCVIMADIDHFKNINDRYGHLRGDEVLKAVAKILIDNTRLKDICARWGGEEFVLVLPSTSLHQAIEIAERIRINIESLQHPDNMHITSSFGIGQKQSGEKMNAFLERVDRNLYRAKQEGRNRLIY
jgi:diguanylate cyclase (GGDEF)-like protein/PAS domain S-box-containing protein